MSVIKKILGLSSVSAINVSGLALLSLLLAKFLSVEQFGITRTITAYMIVLSILGHMTFHDALASKVARAKNDEVRNKYFSTATVFVFINSIFIGILSWVVVSFSCFWTGELRGALSIIVLCLPLITIAILYNNALQAVGSYKGLAIVVLAAGVVPLCIILPLAYFQQLNGWLLGRVLSFLILAFISAYIVRNYLVSFNIYIKELKELFAFAKVQIISGMLSLVLLSADILLIERFLRDLKQVAYYGLAAFFTKAVMFIPTSISRIYFKSIAETSAGITAENKILEFLGVVIVVCGIVAIAMYYIGPIFINLLFGDQYADSVIVLEILSVGIVVMGLWQTISTINISISRPGNSLKISVVGAVVGLLLLTLLIPKYGIEGAAWSMNIAYLSGVLVGLFLLIPEIKKR